MGSTQDVQDFFLGIIYISFFGGGGLVGSHLEVLRYYFWLFPQESCMAYSRDHVGC